MRLHTIVPLPSRFVEVRNCSSLIISAFVMLIKQRGLLKVNKTITTLVDCTLHSSTPSDCVLYNDSGSTLASSLSSFREESIFTIRLRFIYGAEKVVFRYWMMVIQGMETGF
jgi:hypothetical protein